MANIFVRISDVLSANVHHMIDQVEDPERMIKQIIIEMEENIRRAENGVLDAVASEKQLARERKHHHEQAAKWQRKAVTALDAGNESLARSALVKKKEHEEIAADLDGAWESAAATSQRLKSQLRQLRMKLDETRRKRSMLVARQRAAEAGTQVHQCRDRFRKGLDAGTKFDRMESRVFEIEARAEAVAELCDEDTELERDIDRIAMDKAIDGELAELREAMNTRK